LEALDLRPGKAVRVVWEDSASVDGWRQNPEPDVGTIESVGWFVNGNSEALVITTSINDQFSVICPLSIPWRAVVSCEELEEQWRKS
jgi:hypothetical protein